MKNHQSHNTSSFQTKEPRLLFQIKDHVEMIVVAFIMALVIRCFFVEVFKIPTGSMEPTLMGNNKRTGEGGDRIMVNKFYYQFNNVERFDVIVFRYPLNVMRNFIKRAVGIGPEYLRMEKGDIYHADARDGTFRIARKEFGKQQSLWIPLPAAESPPRGTDILDYWHLDGGEGVSQDPNSITLSGGENPEHLTFNRPLRDAAVTSDRPQKSGYNRVKDLKIRSVISSVNSEDHITFSLFDGPFQFTFHLAGPEQSRITIGPRDENKTSRTISLNLPSHITDGRSTVEFFLYDVQVGVTVDGTLVKMKSYRSTYDDLTSVRLEDEGKPRINARKGSFQLHQLGLYRDIYYYWDEGVDGNFKKENEPIKIPEDRFLVIGDNVNSSKDSRKWKMKVITLENGKTYYIDTKTWRLARNGKKQFVADRSGRKFTLSELKPRKKITVQPMKFIRRELLVGKAIWVWWPYDRIKFIR